MFLALMREHYNLKDKKKSPDVIGGLFYIRA